MGGYICLSEKLEVHIVRKDIALLAYKMSKDYVFSLIHYVILVQGLLSSRGGNQVRNIFN